MPTKDTLEKHTSQISRLEQVMTALAEAQVRTEDAQAQTKVDLQTLGRFVTQTAESIRRLSQRIALAHTGNFDDIERRLDELEARRLKKPQ